MTIDNLISWLQEAEDNNTWLVSTQSVKRHLEKIKETEQLTIPVVGSSKRINLVVFEDYTRCYKVSDKELEQLKKDNDIEEGDIVCKVDVIKEY